MDYHLFFMILVLVVILVETILSTKWAPFYFEKGITLFDKLTEFHSSNLDIQKLVNSLNQGFKSSGYSQSIIFQIIDNKVVAFRGKMFEFSLLNYTPLMHGYIIINRRKKTIQVKALSNWFPIAFLILWYSTIFNGLSFALDIIFLVAPVLIFGIIYVVQASRFYKIYNFINETIGKQHLTLRRH